MHSRWKEESQLACTTGNVVCSEVGCARIVYYDGLCSDHWEGPPRQRFCRHWQRAIITCGCCGRVVCEHCYGSWNALACERCRADAR